MQPDRRPAGSCSLTGIRLIIGLTGVVDSYSLTGGLIIGLTGVVDSYSA
jgi:hypothetical protein